MGLTRSDLVTVRVTMTDPGVAAGGASCVRDALQRRTLGMALPAATCGALTALRESLQFPLLASKTTCP